MGPQRTLKYWCTTRTVLTGITTYPFHLGPVLESHESHVSPRNSPNAGIKNSVAPTSDLFMCSFITIVIHLLLPSVLLSFCLLACRFTGHAKPSRSHLKFDQENPKRIWWTVGLVEGPSVPRTTCQWSFKLFSADGIDGSLNRNRMGKFCISELHFKSSF